jgi:hypothetical protein
MATERRVKYNKDPEEKYSILLKFAKAFPIGTSEITAVEVTALKWQRSTPTDREDTDEIFQETAYSISTDKKSVEVFLESGIHNYDYKIRVKVTLDDGIAILIKTFYVRVRNQ